MSEARIRREVLDLAVAAFARSADRTIAAEERNRCHNLGRALLAALREPLGKYTGLPAGLYDFVDGRWSGESDPDDIALIEQLPAQGEA